MKDLKTIVIHPRDETTDFLEGIYKNKGFDKMRVPDFPKIEINGLIDKYDRIILLGHGAQTGLLSGFQFLVDCDNAEILRRKAVIGVFCYAKQFMHDNNLSNSFSTGMFISEEKEADFFQIKTTQKQINQSNSLFAKAVKANLHLSPRKMQTEILKIYQVNDNPIIKFNIRQMTNSIEELKIGISEITNRVAQYYYEQFI